MERKIFSREWARRSFTPEHLIVFPSDTYTVLARLARIVFCQGAMSDTYDSPWKEMLERYFPDFMAFFFPGAYREIDWSRGYESLDQDLQQVVRDAELGERLVDKLMKVWRRNGEEQIVFAHIEVQGEYEATFEQRMFVYNYRIYDRYRKPVVSLAVLGDDRDGWRPSAYGYELWGCRVALSFPIVKLADYNDRWSELEASDNVFAVAVMAHLKTRTTRRDPESRLRWKIRLMRRLYEGGYERQDVLELFRFIDWLLRLPPTLESRFNDELEELEAERKMRYVTSIERRGLEKGREEGFLRGEASVLRLQLKRRFSLLPEWVDHRLEQASRNELERWAGRVIEASALEEVFAAE